MFIFTVKDVIGLSIVGIFIALFISLWLIEKCKSALKNIRGKND